MFEELRKSFDNFCSTILKAINAIHKSGFIFGNDEVEFCKNKSKSQIHTFTAVIYGNKKDRGNLKVKYKKFLENIKYD